MTGKFVTRFTTLRFRIYFITKEISLNIKVLLGFLIAPLLPSVVYTFWVVSDLERYLRAFPIVFGVALLQTFLIAFPIYFYLCSSGALKLKNILLCSVLAAVLPWLILQLLSGLDHEMLSAGGKTLIDDGNLTIHWWIRYFFGMIKLAFCGVIAGFVFSRFVKL